MEELSSVRRGSGAKHQAVRQVQSGRARGKSPTVPRLAVGSEEELPAEEERYDPPLR